MNRAKTLWRVGATAPAVTAVVLSARLRSARLLSGLVLSALGLLTACGDAEDDDDASVVGASSMTSTSASTSMPPASVSSPEATTTPEPTSLPVAPSSSEEPSEPSETNDPEASETTAPGETLAGDESDFEEPESDVEPTEPQAPTPEESEDSDETEEPSATLDAGSALEDVEHCAAVADWDPEWVLWELEVLDLVNEARAVGHNCDSEGDFGPADPLTTNDLLTCAARLHSLDMFERGYFDHINPDGEDPGARIDATGYLWSTYGENIAQGYGSPEEVVDGWLESDGHCSNIMNPNFTELGVGFYPGDTESRFGMNSNYWTQNFGAQREEGSFGGGFGSFGGFGDD